MSLAVYNKLLSDLAVRCSINDPKTLRKSGELISLLNSKRSINCSETCKVLICLELAANLNAVTFSRDTAVKLSGCQRRIYVNNFNNISKLLNLDKVYSIKDICLLTGVSHITNTCVTLFEKFQATSTVDRSALEHPMYACAAVLTVCDEEHHSVNLTRLVDISRIRKTDLKKLSQEFSKLYEKKVVQSAKKEEEECELPNKLLKPIDYCRENKEVSSDEDFKEWKRRMLEED